METFRSSTREIPANGAFEGDDRNRTGATYRSSDSRYLRGNPHDLIGRNCGLAGR